MKLTSYEHNEKASYGVVTDAGLIDLPAAWPDAPPTLRGALELGPDVIAQATAASTDERIGLATVRLLPPITDPPKLIGLAVNYVAHHNELDRPAEMPTDAKHTTTPRPVLMPPTALAAHGDAIRWPAFSDRIDHEVELAVVIGRAGRNIPIADALDHVAGYTIANDFTARGLTIAQGRTERPKDTFFDWLHGKWPDGFCPTGPWLVTRDELGDANDLAIELDVNGQPRQQGRTSEMIFNVAETVSFVSHVMTLQTGDIIATGTPSGVGAASGAFLEAGDTVTCRIEGIGELTNTLGPKPDDFYRPCSP